MCADYLEYIGGRQDIRISLFWFGETNRNYNFIFYDETVKRGGCFMSSSTASKAGWGTAFSVASVWFGTHVGGGFATGNQAIQYYVQYGWLASFLPIAKSSRICLLCCT